MPAGGCSGSIPYRIDIEVYRMGGQAWLDGQPLYAGDATFHTRIGLDLPFTYPPLAAIVFSPFAWMSLPAASVDHHGDHAGPAAAVHLDRADPPGRCGRPSAVTREPAWLRRAWLAAGIVALAVIYLEPIEANFDFGQINVVLMTLVIADCVPRRTPWPRGHAAGPGDRAEADAGGVPAVLPAAPRRPRRPDRGRHASSPPACWASRWPGAIRWSTGPRRCATPTASAARR